MSELDTTRGGYRYRRSTGAGRYITVFDGTAEPYQIDLGSFGRPEVIFGRIAEGSRADIGLNSRLVSRTHGRFVLENGRWYIENLESRNGLIFNNAYIGKREISAGDMFRIGVGQTEREDSVLMLVSSERPEESWSRLPITGPRINIGRDSRCDLVLSEVGVSRLHAVIGRTPQGWAIKDQGSDNGTLVNDRMIRTAVRLHEKDVVTVINTKIIFTGRCLYYSAPVRGISVDARDIVVVRGKGRKSFVTSDHVSMSIRPGELVSIIGGSGAGKSTILNVLCGYLKPQEGTVRINGVSLYENFDAMKKLFGYVPQQDIVYDNLTLYDMLRYTAELRLPPDTDEQERERAIDHAIALVELQEKRDSFIRALSGGQRKRASIAVELLSDPKLLFLDEPASGLDPGTERSLMVSLRKMANAGKTVILVTHSTLQLGLCDKIAFMGKGGRLCFFGNEEEAMRFFRVNDVVDIYARITDAPEEWRHRYEATHPAVIPYRGEEETPRTGTDRQRFRQLKVLCRRYFRLVINDRQRLLLLMLQAPLLAALISLVTNGHEFEHYEMTKSLLFALSCSAFWVGMLNAIQEVCKERTILKREYMTGLSLSAYIGSKMIVMSLLCLLQSLMLSGVFSLLVGLPKDGVIGPPFPEIFLTTWLTSIAAAAMGLLVSSLFTNPDRAMTVAPLLLMPQMLFSGLLFDLSGGTEIISWFATCRWSMEGFGTTCNLNSLPKAMKRVMDEMHMPWEVKPEDFFTFTPEHILRAWLIMVLSVILFLAAARLVLITVKKEGRG